MALVVYNLLLFLLLPVLLLFYAWRLAKGKEDVEHRAERWGKLPPNIARDERRPRFWIHAVSVGEVMAAVPVARALRARFPDALLVLSTITPAGREVARKQAGIVDEVVYFPLDFRFAVQRALGVVRPDAVLLMEWEIWPNFLQAAKRRGAVVAVLNGRVSERGLQRGRRWAFLLRPGLNAVDLFAMQSDEDARRAQVVGANAARIETLGNTKFDEFLAALHPDERQALRADLGIGEQTPVWVCGSTRPGEEAIIAQAAKAVRARFPDLCLLIAPRHLERADEVETTLRALGLPVTRRSRQREAALTPGPSPNNRGGEKIAGADAATSAPAPPGARYCGRLGAGGAILLDTFGELGRVYAVADVAFVGGSLLPFGGQSVFQPLAQGVPAVFGPFMNNQRDIAALAQAAGVGFPVRDADTLAVEVVRLLCLSPEEKQALSKTARTLIERNQGVARRCVEAVARLLEKRNAAANLTPP